MLPFSFAALRHFEPDLPDIYVNSTRGNVAIIPCQPPRAIPPAMTRFEIDGVAVDHSTRSECQTVGPIAE